MADETQQQKQRVLVTGATGFIGSKLVHRLHELGFKIRTFGRSHTPASQFAGLNIEHYGGDITNPEQVSSAVQDCDIIFHLAGLVSYKKRDIQRQFGVNVLGTRNILEAAQKANVKRIIHTSSVAAIGVPEKGTIGTEELEYNLLGKGLNYCDSKYEAELQVRHFYQDGVPVLMLNPGIIFGEGDTHPHHHQIFESMSKGNLFGVPPGGIPFSDINDVVDAHINAITMGRLGERYVLVSANLSFRDAALVFCKQMKTKPPAFEFPGWFLVAAGSFAENVLPNLPKWKVGSMTVCKPINVGLTRQQTWLSQHKIFFSSQKAVEELNFHQTPFEETVRRTAPYYLGVQQKRMNSKVASSNA
ncbi:MAG TPA: SDR family NAD(P)-dependent oxidoreductase [Drouetiella sp.]